VNAIKRTFKDASLFFSVSTLTGFQIANERLGHHADGVFYYPYDFIFSVRRIIGRINPTLMLIVETDIWPNFLYELKRRKIPVILVNARFSDRSFKGYLRLSFFLKPVFRSFTKVCVQSAPDLARISRLGILPENIAVTGNIKFEKACETSDSDNGVDIRRRLKTAPGQKVFIAGSTHDGEESMILEAFLRMRQQYGNLLLIVVPRDPDRAPLVNEAFQSKGLQTALFSELDPKGSASPGDAVVVDTMGVLGRLYAMADVAYVGGSLVNRGGHNPLEPAAYAKPILFGPDMSDFKDIAQKLLASGGAVQIQDTETLYEVVMMLFRDGNKAERMGRKAHEILCANRGAIARTVAVVKGCIPERTGR